MHSVALILGDHLGDGTGRPAVGRGARHHKPVDHCVVAEPAGQRVQPFARPTCSDCLSTTCKIDNSIIDGCWIFYKMLRNLSPCLSRRYFASSYEIVLHDAMNLHVC